MNFNTPITVSHRTEDRSVDIDLEIAMVKSWRSFVKYFGDARTIQTVTYSQSPQIVHEAFHNEQLDIDSLEVVVGDYRQSEYRKDLQGDLDLAAQLNHLLQDDQLRLFTLDKQVTLHSKLYLIENHDESRTLILGSPNLSKQAWEGNQTNMLIAFTTDGSSIVDEWFERFYDAHREQCEVFMEDLTERLEDADTAEERSEELHLWVDGTVPSNNPTGDLHRRIAELLDEDDERIRRINVAADPEEADEVVSLATDGSGDIDPTDVQPNKQIRLSPQGLEAPVKSAKPTLTRHNVVVKPTELRGSPAGFARYMQGFNDDFPLMWINEDEESVRMQVDNTTLILTAEPDDPAEVDAALAHLESYIETIQRFGDTKHSEATMAHFYEALIYFFWAPFANSFARHYAGIPGAELDKDLPFLYIHGGNDSGKGMFIRFATKLISNGYVTEPVEGNQFKKDAIDRCRSSNTVFPFVVDDVDKDNVERDIVKTYWEGGWDGSVAFPTFIFTSNHTKPKSEFRTRMKVLDFDVMFDVTGDEREEAARIANQENRLFTYFSHLMFKQEVSLPDRSDKLAAARDVFCQLYEFAGRTPPAYFPEDGPAEVAYDHGRQVWQHAYESGLFTIEEQNGVVRTDFSADLESRDVWKYQKLVPPTIRTDKQRARIEFPQPARFYEWTGIEPRPGLLERLGFR